MTLRDLVAGKPFIVGPLTTLRELAVGLAERGHGSAGVVDGRRLAGIVTERDLVKAIAADLDIDTTPVTEIMSPEPDTFDADTDLFEAGEFLLQMGYRHLPVVDGDDLLGVVSLRDLLRAVLDATESE